MTKELPAEPLAWCVMTPAGERRWSNNKTDARRMYGETPGALIVTYTRAEAAKLPAHIRAEALAQLPSK